MRRLPILVFLLAFLWAVSASGASTGASRAEREPSPVQALQQGIDLYRGGKTEEALVRLRGFVVRHPDSPLLSEAYLYLARIFADKGQHQEALLYIGRIPPERRGGAARLVEGRALVAQGEAERGLGILQNIPADSLSPEERRQRLSALADGNARTGKPLSALTFLRRAMEDASPREAEELLQQAHLLLRDRLGEGELAEAAAHYAGTPLGEDARLQQALRAFARGDRDTARTLAQGIVRGSVPFPYRRDAVLLLERLRDGASAARAVGVILPLSGRYGSFGGLVHRGMELALELHGGSGVQFLFTDAEGDAERSAQAVSELASDRRVMALAGPLTSAAAAAAAARAEQEKVPLLSLSQKEGLPQVGGHVFRLSLTAHAQVEALVEYAMGEKGLTTFAVLAPENRLGREMGELFVREVEKRGGKVAARLGYPENATDFKLQVQQLQGRGQPAPEGRGAAEKKEPVTVQALFIPDQASRVALVAPQLAYYGLQGVQLLGTNGWNSPELTRLAGRSVEGAVFTDGFFRGSPSPAVREFVGRYKEKFGEDPSILEAQGFDVASILLSVLADPAVRTRDDLRQALSRLNNYPGVTGTTTFDQDGEARKSLFLLQVRGGEIVQIN